VAPTALDTNYRTNDEIAAWPRKRFYPEGYEAASPKRRLSLTLSESARERPGDWPEPVPWSREFATILDPDLPVVVITYDEHPYTLSNPFEAQMVAALTLLYRRALEDEHEVLTEEKFWGERLGIVTPHRAQMSTVRNLLENAAGMTPTSLPFVDTVDRFQGQERDLIIASYTVADRDFVASEAEFILDPRRFNVTLTRARSKFVMFVSDAVLGHLPSEANVAREAAHLQLFVADYCSAVDEPIILPFIDRGKRVRRNCRLRGHE
jgi:superfamily I DNA and/or RNA helicase